MSKIRREVLKAFKKLHRARQTVFNGDERALAEGRRKINEAFRKNAEETDEHEIKKMLQLAIDVEHELRSNVIQAVEMERGMYQLRITEDTTRLENIPFNPFAIPSRPRRKAPSGCVAPRPPRKAPTGCLEEPEVVQIKTVTASGGGKGKDE